MSQTDQRTARQVASALLGTLNRGHPHFRIQIDPGSPVDGEPTLLDLREVRQLISLVLDNAPAFAIHAKGEEGFEGFYAVPDQETADRLVAEGNARLTWDGAPLLETIQLPLVSSWEDLEAELREDYNGEAPSPEDFPRLPPRHGRGGGPAVSASASDHPDHAQFVLDMKAAGLKTRPYRGRFSWEGPAVVVDDLMTALSATSVVCQWDHFGLGFIVYPRAYKETS